MLDISVHRLRIPLTKPYRLSFGTIEHYDTIVVEMTDQDGRVGFGEATVLTGYTEETIEDAWRVARHTAQDISSHPLPAAYNVVARAGKTYPFTATAFGSALEMLSQSHLLAVPPATAIPLVGLLHANEEDEIRTEFEHLLAAGYRTIKVKVGFEPKQDARTVATVQKVVNGRAAIRIDANQGYSAEQGIAFVRALDPRGIELFEQPCPAGDWESHLSVVRASCVPLMLDESIYGVSDIEKAAQLGAAAYIKLKLMKFVTLDALVRGIERILALGMHPVLGNGVACDLGCWMEGCIAARYIDNAGEMNGFLKATAPLLTPGLAFREGTLYLDPGFTPRFNVEILERYRVDSMSFSPRPGVIAAS